MRGPYFYWSFDREAFVAQRWGEGASAGFIARELGTTRNAVIGKVHRMGLPSRSTNSQSNLQRGKNRRRRLVAVPRKPKPRTPYIAPEPVYVPVDPIRFLDRLHNQCAFIPGEPKVYPPDEIMCCGHETVAGTSWCSLHLKLVSQPDKKRDRRSDNGKSASRFVLYDRSAA